MPEAHNFRPLIVAAVFASIACVFWTTASYLLGIGREADPSTHSAPVILVVLILIWNLRDELAILPIRPVKWGFIGLLVLGFFWLAGQLVFTRVLTQFAVLAMIPMAVLTLLGTRWLISMAFPFFMLLFALPVWSPLVPTLVKWSANFAEFAIHASGVPVYRDGAYFVVPSGSWSIADTCSGVAFLSTSLLLGILYAWSIFQSPVKRIVFIFGSAVIGVVGNWIRVYLTIMIAHHTDNRYLRDDHYMFGWLLFAVFLFVFCWFGWRCRDAAPTRLGGSLSNDHAGITRSAFLGEVSVQKFSVIAAMILVSLVIWPLLESKLSVDGQTPAMGVENISPNGGWSSVPGQSIGWTPEIRNPSHVRVQTFEKHGERVDVFVGIYSNETWDSKLVTVSNRLAGTDNANWSLADRGSAVTDVLGAQLNVKTAVILGRNSRVLAWHWYWIHGLSTANDTRAKLQQLLLRLQSVQTAPAWIAIYTSANVSSEVSTKVLQEFMHDMGPSLGSALTRTAKR